MDRFKSVQTKEIYSVARETLASRTRRMDEVIRIVQNEGVEEVKESGEHGVRC